MYYPCNAEFRFFSSKKISDAPERKKVNIELLSGIFTAYNIKKHKTPIFFREGLDLEKINQ